MAHPLGVRPCIGDDHEGPRSRSLGKLSMLPDEVVINVLSFLEAKDLARLAAVSQYLCAFAHHDDLWRGIVLEVDPQRPRLRGVASDLLHQPWFYASVRIDPGWLDVDNVERRQAAELTREQFVGQYERPNRPVVLTDVVRAWPAFKKWDREYLRRAFEGKKVIVGDAPMSFDAYCTYADTNSDELPLYLFDKNFCKTAPQLAADFTPPNVLGEDLFALLGDRRPDYRWLIIGPIKSGSSYHKDPNATSAWNGLISGKKKWLCYPPHVTPPGVRPSADGTNVATSLSLMEWFVNYYDHRAAAGCSPVEFVQHAGELVYVPRGWWHCVINLEESLAITQNFVTEVDLPHTLTFLQAGKSNPDLVSGCSEDARASLYDAFLGALARDRPDALARAQRELEERRRKAEEHHKLASLFSKAPGAGTSQPTAAAERTSGSSAASSAATGGTFSFGFKV